jgi:hypothetical protein
LGRRCPGTSTSQGYGRGGPRGCDSGRRRQVALLRTGPRWAWRRQGGAIPAGAGSVAQGPNGGAGGQRAFAIPGPEGPKWTSEARGGALPAGLPRDQHVGVGPRWACQGGPILAGLAQGPTGPKGKAQEGSHLGRCCPGTSTGQCRGGPRGCNSGGVRFWQARAFTIPGTAGCDSGRRRQGCPGTGQVHRASRGRAGGGTGGLLVSVFFCRARPPEG